VLRVGLQRLNLILVSLSTLESVVDSSIELYLVGPNQIDIVSTRQTDLFIAVLIEECSVILHPLQHLLDLELIFVLLSSLNHLHFRAWC